MHMRLWIKRPKPNRINEPFTYASLIISHHRQSVEHKHFNATKKIQKAIMLKSAKGVMKESTPVWEVAPDESVQPTPTIFKCAVLKYFQRTVHL